ncbi:MAG: VTT domain-containing protein [Oligoflexia bacterium]|nr:VTT domain-containing protein [Oligoflexia bacterium]
MKFIKVTIFIIFCIFILGITGANEYFTPEAIQAVFEKHFLISTLIFILLFCIGNILYVPGWVFLIGAVWGVGKVNAYFITLIAAYISCIVGFHLIHFIGEDAIREIDNKWVKRLLAKLDERPVLITIILRSIFATAPILNYAMAMSGVPFRKFMTGTLLGLPLPILLYAIFIEKLIKLVS